MDFTELSKKTKDIIGDSKLTISGIGCDCNPLQFEDKRKEPEYCIENAHLFGANNVKIGIANCPMCEFWYRNTGNIGYCPKAWEMMFDAVDNDAIGLEWEPSHQLEQFIAPIEQVKEWIPEIVHIHGKDAQINWNYIKKYGAWYGEKLCQ